MVPAKSWSKQTVRSENFWLTLTAKPCIRHIIKHSIYLTTRRDIKHPSCEWRDSAMLCYINPTEKWAYRYCSDAYMVEPVVSSGVTWRDYSKKRNNTFTHAQNNQGFESLNRLKPPPKLLTRHCQGHLWLETLQLKSCSRDLHVNGLVSAWHRNNNKCLCSHSCTLGEQECLVMG